MGQDHDKDRRLKTAQQQEKIILKVNIMESSKGVRCSSKGKTTKQRTLSDGNCS